ncbi:thioredoxin family protein [Polaribacter sp.]|uniref:thioredoxin family protein n=1 Tax=Polaribacter sp. TaxID=1920175 RepID=UPI003EF2DF2B
MKKTITILTIAFLSFTVKAQEKVNWMSLNEALELQKTAPKKIIMDVFTNWCGPCKMLDKNTFQNPDVAAFINENYYAVKFNGEGNDSIVYKENTFKNTNFKESLKNKRNSSHEFADYMGINAYPTIVFMNDKGDFIMPLRGYYSPNQLEFYLKLFKGEDYKKIDTKEKFEAYNNEFKPEFKEKS